MRNVITSKCSFFIVRILHTCCYRFVAYFRRLTGNCISSGSISEMLEPFIYLFILICCCFKLKMYITFLYLFV